MEARMLLAALHGCITACVYSLCCSQGQDSLHVLSYTALLSASTAIRVTNMTYTCDPAYGEQMETSVLPR